MTDSDIKYLAGLVKSGLNVCWNPDDQTCRKIMSVTNRHFEDPELDEPGLCANFIRGEYAALYNCELTDFGLLERLGE